MQNRPIIIGVTGGSGGGKTSVSRAILSHFPDENFMIEHDSYSQGSVSLWLFEEQVSKPTTDHPFALDTDLMGLSRFKELLAGRPVDIPTYDLYSCIHGVARPIVREPQDVFIKLRGFWSWRTRVCAIWWISKIFWIQMMMCVLFVVSSEIWRSVVVVSIAWLTNI